MISNEAKRISQQPHSDTSVRLWLGTFTGVFIWSGVHPADWLAWLINIIPAFISLSLIILTHKRFPLTRMTYVLLLFYMIIMMISAHFASYQMLVRDYLQVIFQFQPMKKDILIHIVHGAVPAIVFREILLRKQIVSGNGWLLGATLSACLSLSALHHVIDWWIALFLESLNSRFVLADHVTKYAVPNIGVTLCGAIIAILILGKMHDQEMSMPGFQD